ncbi:hypothetical protein V8J88_15580 [Massilia sp. W12]|uniref:hypothetical protein n=1 Tax=Massilia sp. W12 TaxID=3126507 RepID=UPI0030D0DB75
MINKFFWALFIWLSGGVGYAEEGKKINSENLEYVLQKLLGRDDGYITQEEAGIVLGDAKSSKELIKNGAKALRYFGDGWEGWYSDQSKEKHLLSPLRAITLGVKEKYSWWMLSFEREGKCISLAKAEKIIKTRGWSFVSDFHLFGEYQRIYAWKIFDEDGKLKYRNDYFKEGIEVRTPDSIQLPEKYPPFWVRQIHVKSDNNCIFNIKGEGW